MNFNKFLTENQANAMALVRVVVGGMMVFHGFEVFDSAKIQEPMGVDKKPRLSIANGLFGQRNGVSYRCFIYFRFIYSFHLSLANLHDAFYNF
jgi:hypothetical protein